MRIVVQKYGGSSVGSVEKIRRVAEKVAATRQKGYRVVVVVSAMGGQTDHLLGLARAVSDDPSLRELDMLLSTGERVSTALLSMALHRLGADAVSLSGDQCRIRTDDTHGSARIVEVHPDRILHELAQDRVVVVAGFQGVDSNEDVTTLGRGGSDTTAVALAAALGAEHCDIYSDVDGVYSCDPRIVPTAQRLDEVGYEEMQELARQGAKVLNEQAVEFARGKEIAIHAAATFGGPEKTVIRKLEESDRSSSYGAAGVAGRSDVLRVSYDRTDGDGPRTGEVLDLLETDYELLHGDEDGRRIDVLVSGTNIPCHDAFVTKLNETFTDAVRVSPPLATVAAVGRGMGEEPRALAHALKALRKAGIRVLRDYTTTDAVSCLVPADHLHRSMQSVHGAFIDARAMDTAGGAA